MSRLVIKGCKWLTLMEISEEQENSNDELSLVFITRELIVCTDPAQLRRLQTKFYEYLAPRLYDRMFKVCSKLFSGIPDWEMELKEILSDTFLHAFKTIHKFKMGDQWDEGECQKVLLFRLGEIANRKLLNLTKTTKKGQNDYESYKLDRVSDDRDGDFFERKNYRLTYDKTKFVEFWSKLNPMSKEILIECINYSTIYSKAGSFISDEELEILKIKNDISTSAVPKKWIKKMSDKSIERNTDHLPDHVIKRLTDKYSVTSAAIRKAKQRALKGLEKCKI